MESSTAEQSSPAGKEQEAASVRKIQVLLTSKDDTSRFVGLALLKSVLDSSPALQADEAAITTLWQSVSPRFLDRLLRTAASGAASGSKKEGQRAGKDGGREMLDIAVAVLHAFVLLLPEGQKRESRLVGRVPLLTAAVLHSSGETTEQALRILVSLASYPEGAGVFVRVEDVSALVEIAPTHPGVLDVFYHAWTTAAGASAEDRDALAAQAKQALQSLASSFKGTDAVTLLAFLDRILRSLDPATILPETPTWLPSVVAFIRALTARKPTPASRAAYTNLAATLLQTCPTQAPPLLFSSDTGSEGSGGSEKRPFAYHFLTLLLIDLRASFPSLLEQLNNASYPETSRRLASALDVLSSFTGYLVRSLDAAGADAAAESGSGVPAGLCMPPSLLLKLRKAVSETLSDAIDHLRDRYDAAVAGAPGLHPSARAGLTRDGPAARLPIAWDAKTAAAGRTGSGVARDPLVLAAVRALALWLRDDEGEALRREAAGLADLLMDLYRWSAESSDAEPLGEVGRALDFRGPVLVALEGITAVPSGVEALLAQDGWAILTADLLQILRASSDTNDPAAAARGTEVVRVLLPVVEAERPGPREAWMDVVTAVAGWQVPPDGARQSRVVHEFQCGVLQLVTALVVGAHPGMRRRYVHSIAAVAGIAQQLRGRDGVDEVGREELDEIIDTLGSLR